MTNLNSEKNSKKPWNFWIIFHVLSHFLGLSYLFMRFLTEKCASWPPFSHGFAHISRNQTDGVSRFLRTRDNLMQPPTGSADAKWCHQIMSHAAASNQFKLHQTRVNESHISFSLIICCVQSFRLRIFVNKATRQTRLTQGQRAQTRRALFGSPRAHFSLSHMEVSARRGETKTLAVRNDALIWTCPNKWHTNGAKKKHWLMLQLAQFIISLFSFRSHWQKQNYFLWPLFFRHFFKLISKPLYSWRAFYLGITLQGDVIFNRMSHLWAGKNLSGRE